MQDNQVALRFTGRAGEYFLIWIVNICLTVITLGIYSAWAKVRRKRYFYGNTFLNDSSFDYLASPKAILLGRVLVVAIFVAYSVTSELVPLAAVVFFPLLLIAFPWLVVRALRFNARNSAHRNLRFGFHGSYGGVWLSLVLPSLLAVITLGLAFPFFLHRRDRYLINHSSYGATRFSFQATLGAYYLTALKIFLASVGFLIGTIVSLGILALPLYILARAYAVAVMARLKWGNTRLGEIGFSCDWGAGGLFALYFVNALAIVFSLGLLIPWTAIRTARYQLERISLSPASAVASFAAASEGQVAAFGEEAGELLGFDFGL